LKTRQELDRALRAAAAAVVDPQLVQVIEGLPDYVLISSDLVASLAARLAEVDAHTIELAKLDAHVLGPTLEIPDNVRRTLVQYKTWGVDLWDYSKVEQKCKEYQDMDVLTWLVQHREDYRYVAGQLA
jgi:hypothetical protein